MTGGGTAGHVLPNMALVPALRRTFDIHYIGGTNAAERAMVESEGVPFHALRCVKFHRGIGLRQLWRNMKIPTGYMASVREAGRLLDEIRPDVVFSKGGFVALPVVRAAAKRGIPVILHESDATMGLANKLCVGAASVVCTTFPIGKSPKFVHTGSPIRQKIYRGDKEKVKTPAPTGHPLYERGRNLLVVGGSLGAAKINETVRAASPKLGEKYNVIHICGKGKTQNPHELEYAPNIEDYLAWADVVVSRAGSNALCELMVLGKPTLFIPMSTGRGDQIANVAFVRGCAGVLLEENLTPESLVLELENVWRNREAYSAAAKKIIKDGTETLAKTIASHVFFDKNSH